MIKTTCTINGNYISDLLQAKRGWDHLNLKPLLSGHIFILFFKDFFIPR